MEKFIAICAAICGVILFIAGLVNGWLPHMIIGLSGLALATFLFIDIMARRIPYHDEINNRIYRYATDSDSPRSAPCPKCKQQSRIIYTLTNKRRYGIYCENCQAERWFDLEKKEE